MAHYGNILTIFEATGENLEQVRNVLTDRHTDFESMDNTFFVETNSKTNTREVMDELSSLGIEFIFFHNSISDGSMIRAGGLNEDFVDRVNHILFE